ncbi:MAG: hypothetical protein M3O82_09330 [Verrucomicrobiota bacterium]|nr:hypothetical protein [Verrucomicrobiota bacterium]
MLRWLFVAGFAAAAPVARADTLDQSLLVLIEPSFFRPQVSFPIPGAERTCYVPASRVGDELVYFSKKEFTNLNLTWPHIFELGRKAAETELEKCKPVFSRNKREVIEYALVRSERQLAGTLVLAPKFLKLFEDTLGPKVLVAIPNRYSLYVFPALASNYRQFGPMIIDAYKSSAYPVSLEVFEISENGMRATGTFEE